MAALGDNATPGHGVGDGAPLTASTRKSVVLVSGASSQIGVFLVSRLLEAGFKVCAVSRNARRRNLEFEQDLCWLHPDSIGNDQNQQEFKFMVSCGPLDFATKTVRGLPGLERLVVFSTSSVYHKIDSPVPGERQEIEAIIEWEGELKRLCSDRDLPLVLLRPTLIYGCGLDRNISLLASWIRRFGFVAVSGRATGLRQPVHADDLACAAVSALRTQPAKRLEGPACGGAVISYRDMVELIFMALGKTIKIISLPAWLLSGALRTLALLPAWSGVNPQMARRQNVDLVFDDSEVRAALNFNPRSFQPTAADFAISPELMVYRLPPG